MDEQQRLPSFKPPRDFTLSRVVIPKSSKRVFTPTIPPKRNHEKEKSDGSKVTDAGSTAPDVPSTSSCDNNRHHGRQKIPPRGGGGRGRGERRKPDLIQTNSSIFSEGVSLSQPKATRRSGYRGGGDDASGIGSPNASKPSKRKVKKDLDQDDKFSLGGIGDFIVGDSEGESSGDDKHFEVDPIILPLANQMEKMTKLKSEEKVIQIKKELNEDDDGQIKAADQYSKFKDKNSFAQVVTQDLQGPTIAFFQFPDRLPILEQDDITKDSKEMKLVSDISSLNEGLIGKIQILSDGRSIFYFGDDNAFDISSGISTGFRQDLVEIDSEDTKFNILSQVSKKFILTPDIESILDLGTNNKPNS